MVPGFLTIWRVLLCTSGSDEPWQEGVENVHLVTDGSRKEWDFINEADLLGQNLNPVANFNDRSSIGESQQQRYRASDGPYPVLPLDSRNLSPAALQVQVDGSRRGRFLKFKE